MGSIINNFDFVSSENADKYILKSNNRNLFLNEFSYKSRLCYISNCRLKYFMRIHGLSAKECLEQFILPDFQFKTIISGDFGEMLSFFLIKENLESSNFKVLGPKKWQWKGDRNKAAQGSDIIFFHSVSKTPSESDTVISVECKMKSVDSKRHPLQDAVDGAINDSLSRMVKSLHWFDEKLAKENKVNLRKKLRRFRIPSEYVSYKKQSKAVAIIDSQYFNDELNKEINKNNFDIDIFAISVQLLKGAYEDNYFNILNIP